MLSLLLASADTMDSVLQMESEFPVTRAALQTSITVFFAILRIRSSVSGVL